MVLVYLPTKLGDFVRANFCQTFQHHGDPWSIWDPNVPVLFEPKSQELKVAGFSLDFGKTLVLDTKMPVGCQM